MPRRIGILGGMGPQATILLMQRLVDAVSAEDDADHIPLIVDSNTQVPSRVRALIDGDGEDPGPVLSKMARRLEDAGAVALAMPCNTAHHYAGQIRAAVSIPFLDMVQLSADRALSEAGPGAKVGILASPAVQLTNVFGAALAERGQTAFYPQDQESLLAAIQSIKKSGASPAARERLRAASLDLIGRGIVVQLVACTEFSIIADAVAPEALAIDTLDVLTEEIVRVAT